MMPNDLDRFYFEDLNVGDEVETPGRTITEADIFNYAAVSGDYNPLHTDEEFMKKSIFKGRVAHGLLVLAASTGLITRVPWVQRIAAIAFLDLTCKLMAPVMMGDTIKAKVKVGEKKETTKPDRGIVRLDRAVINQRGETVQEVQINLLVHKRQR